MPTIAIVGRPNVGKSSLFNRLVGQPIAIVDPTPGVTRDRLLHQVRRDGFRFDLIDTGGIGIVDEKKLEADVYRQVERAIGAADRIIFLVDGREGLSHLDREIAIMLRPLKAKVVLAVNKIDIDSLEHEVHQFRSLGLGEPSSVSAAQAIGISDLVERLCTDLPGARNLTGKDSEDDEDGEGDEEGNKIGANGQKAIRLCLVGRRNVGKSSLTNALCGEDRVIVKDWAGTTRDAIDVPLDHEGQRYILVDTAGLRKRSQIEEDVEFYAACRTERAIRRCQVVVLVLDAADDLGMVDKRIASFCESEAKPTIVVVNKWDLAEKGGATREQYHTWLQDRLPALRFAPVVFTCALTGYQVPMMLRLASELLEETLQRVSTSRVNDLLAQAVQRRRPKKTSGHHLRIFYATQAAEIPPTFILFVNRTDHVEAGYARYLEGFFRDHLPFKRIPLKILFKTRETDRHGELDDQLIVTGKPKAERDPILVIPRRAKPRIFRPKRKGAKDQGADDDSAAESGSGTGPGSIQDQPRRNEPGSGTTLIDDLAE